MSSPALSPRTAARLFLLAAAAVVLLIGAQTLLALRSQQRMAQRVLHDHAATALWYFEQNFESELSAAVECAFHPALHTGVAWGNPGTMRTGVQHRVAPPAQLLLDTWFAEGQECAAIASYRPAAAFRLGPDHDVEIAGAAASATYVDELRTLVEAAASDRPALRRTDGMAVGLLAGEPRIVLYSRQLVPGGAAIYAVPLEPASTGVLIVRAVREFRLLPPPVLPDTARDTVMRLAVGLPNVEMFRTSAPGAAITTATRELPESLGGLVATIEVTPAGAAVLARAPLPAAHMTALLALLGLSLGLVLLAYRHLRREQELARLRGDFVASVSHELRTPLALQRIFLDTIRLGRAPSSERMTWAVENIDREAHRLEHLVSNILHFARSERGQVELEPHSTELVAAVERTVAVFRPLAEQREARIVVAAPARIAVALDQAAFHQALGNVLENAIKYGPDGQCITVRVTAAAPWAIIDVDDQGPGLPEDERAHVFEPFRRGRGTRGGAVAGSGIGLAVVQDVIILHGGHVSLDDAPDGGLRVTLTLPLLTTQEVTSTPRLDTSPGVAASR